MIVNRQLLMKLLKKIYEAEAETLKEVEQGLLPKTNEGALREVSITGSYRTRLVDKINGMVTTGVIIRAKEIDCYTEERPAGADLAIVLYYEFGNFVLNKAVLVQAKSGFFNNGADRKSGKDFFVSYNGDPWPVFPPETEYNVRVLKDPFNISQAEKMHAHTAASFFLVYTEQGFFFLPASSVKGLLGANSFYCFDSMTFYSNFILCKVGDSDEGRLKKLGIPTSYSGRFEDLSDRELNKIPGVAIELQGKGIDASGRK